MPAQHGRVQPGEARGASAVSEEATNYSVYLDGRPPDRLLCCKQGLGMGWRLDRCWGKGPWGWPWVGSLLQRSWLFLREGQVIGVLFRGIQ